MQHDQNEKPPVEEELSATWLELLGATVPSNQPQAATDEAGIPVLESDPWRDLLQGEDIALVDLQKIALHAADQDVERALQVMREQADDASQ
ncbi:MAG TPA: hypothetical protein VL485_18210 [Ktedonobacteraceae bacterium]|jgi:hypothetical protein|nr:hypothetical protein [Ktedonobacteraceae bacterium]